MTRTCAAFSGTSTAEVIGPGSRWQIDATISDVCLVSRMDRSWIVGRPTLYFVIDVFSRMIVGLHVGLEAPSWVGAMSALVNAASDKVAFCKAHGIEIEPEDWPCQGLPDVMLGDRSEMLGGRADVLVKHFGVRLENTPPYRADLNGIVEKRFHLIQADFGPVAEAEVRTREAAYPAASKASRVAGWGRTARPSERRYKRNAPSLRATTPRPMASGSSRSRNRPSRTTTNPASRM